MENCLESVGVLQKEFVDNKQSSTKLVTSTHRCSFIFFFITRRFQILIELWPMTSVVRIRGDQEMSFRPVVIRPFTLFKTPLKPEVDSLDVTVGRRPQVKLRSRARHWSGCTLRPIECEHRSLDLRLTWGFLPQSPFKKPVSGHATWYYCTSKFCSVMYVFPVHYFCRGNACNAQFTYWSIAINLDFTNKDLKVFFLLKFGHPATELIRNDNKEAF